MTDRTAEQLLEAWSAASKEHPLILNDREVAVFTEALRRRNDRRQKRAFEICNREAVMGDGIQSMIDGSVHTTRRSYENHLKEHGCHVKDYTLKKRPTE